MTRRQTMKLTKANLKKLIKEELLKEMYDISDEEYEGESEEENFEREQRLRRTSGAVDIADEYHSEKDMISVEELRDGLRDIFTDEKMVEDLLAKILGGAQGQDVDDFVSKRMY